MLFKDPLKPAKLLRRYKRFLADVELPDTTQLTVHCPNTGSMLGCNEPGLPVMISRSDNPKRKYPHTLEMVKVETGWVGINTSLTNKLVREALENALFPELGQFDTIRPEVKTGNSRLDFLLSNGNKLTYLEVKNCTMARANIALFPDAVTARGTKHLEELLRLHEKGHRAALIFCIQMAGVTSFSPAADIDPLYAETLAGVVEQGVLALACRAEVTPKGIVVTERLPVVI
ncbi:MAG: DNA/RNA nuclease SfsA [Desulfobulbaceae bacterium]|nr:DNA/RNA nuclease SfsA [Desulfobulbaceae bacterium]